MMVPRSSALLVLAALLGACAPQQQAALVETSPAPAPAPAATLDASRYAGRPDGGHYLPAIDVAAFPPGLLRQEVDFPGDEPAGTVVIDTSGPFLYLVEPEARATRFGIAVGKEGFGWTGSGTIARRSRWPGWTPPPEMIKRDPALARWRDGMPGGPTNPLGARALYIYFGGQDSGYRIHGTNQPKSIGWAASSGCFRMLNQDVVELYERVPNGAKVVVR